MHFPNVSLTSCMIVNVDSDLLMLCTISNFHVGVRLILGFLQGKKGRYRNQNVCGQTALHFAAINGGETASLLLRSRLLLPIWDCETYGKSMNFAMYAA